MNGPGAVVDFRDRMTKAPISGLVAGLEEWDLCADEGQKGAMHPQCIYEPRLEQRLSVRCFRQPPVKRDGDPTRFDILPIVRFPDWLLCPRCERLDRAGKFAFDPGKPDRRCSACSARQSDPVYAIPVRFIVACENGHIDEFPWKTWIGCTCSSPRLQLITKGAGLAGKVVKCTNPGCAARERSLEGAFTHDALTKMGMHCHGRRPWLPARNEAGCDKAPRVIQRGASSLYYPSLESSLDIPPFSTDLSRIFGLYWPTLKTKPEEKWPIFIEMNDLEQQTGKPAEVLLRTLKEWKSALDSQDDEAPIEWAEYQKFVEASHGPIHDGEFQVRPEPVPPEFRSCFSSVILGQRLREVRAQTGFTRIKPPSGPFSDPTSRNGRLSIQPREWLPAVELRGEGVFLRFDLERIREWEQRLEVVGRSQILRQRRQDVRSGGAEPEDEAFKTSPRFVLLHSFAHALMRQLSLASGYGSAALRERLFVGVSPREMVGVLIHTGTTDAEGTLGGLVRQGQSDFLVLTVRQTLRAARWCSSDPLCITGAITLSSPGNLAACHSCLLVPETSCQHYNLLLDRALLVGTPECAHIGFFSDFFEEIG